MIISGTLWALTLASSSAYTPPNLHRVGKSETFASISRRYHTGYERLISANPKIVPEKLRPGTVILIPGRVKTQAKAPSAGKFAVQNGDTDWSVAKRYSIKPSELRAMNPGVKWTSLRPGTVINVPAKNVAKTIEKPSAKPAMQNIAQVKKATFGKHAVGQDENDWIIARGYGITPSRLRQINPGVNWNRLRPGTKINVPVKKAMIAQITTKRAKVVKDNVLVRSGARTDSSRVAMVDYGRIASVADRIGSWYKLKFDGGTIGWVRGDLLKPVTASMIAHAGATSSPRSIRRNSSSSLVARRTNAEPAPRRITRVSTGTKRGTRQSATPSYENTVALSDTDRDGVIGTAMSRMGTRYRWGGTTPAGFDCSGFTGYVYARNGKRLPRTASEQSKQGQSVGKGELKKGDLVFFKTTRSDRVSHVGIYVGEGKFVHASSGGGRVRVNNLSDSYYSKRFAGAKRVSGGSGSSSSSRSRKSSESESKPKHEEAKEEVATKSVVADEPKPATVKGTDVVGR